VWQHQISWKSENSLGSNLLYIENLERENYFLKAGPKETNWRPHKAEKHLLTRGVTSFSLTM